MTDLYAALLHDLTDEQADLDARVTLLPGASWGLPTPAEGWTIGDTILHLALTDEVAALAAEDPVQFEALRAERRTRGANPFEARRGLPAAELLALWRANRQRLLDALERIDAKQRVDWFGPPMSATSHATARLMETWAHGQDIVDALGVERPATPRLRHIAHLGVRTRGYSYSQHGLTPPELDVRVELAGPDGDVWTWGNADVENRVSGSAMDFCLVVVQRRHLDDTDLVYSGAPVREWLLIAQAFAGAAGAGRQPGQFPRRRTHCAAT